MAKRKNEFSNDVRTRVLLWCDRHCCICKRICDVYIEVDHIVRVEEGGTKDIDNAIPVCFDCHAKLHHYDDLHPRGTKYRVSEIKTRRNQVYAEFTRHLVPPIHYQVTQQRSVRGAPPRVFPDVSFIIQHLGDSLPVRVITRLNIKLGKKSLGPPPAGGHYAGEKLWRLNPRMLHEGHFQIPKKAAVSQAHLEVEVNVTIIDTYGYNHELLPVGWVYRRQDKSWYFEP